MTKNTDFISESSKSSFMVYKPDGSYVSVPCTRHLMVRNGGFFPALVQLKSGELVAVVRGGTWHEGAPPGKREACLNLVRSFDGGESWSQPHTIIDSEDDDRDPTLGYLSDGTLVLAYSRRRPYRKDETPHPSGFRYDEAWYTRSEDDGLTWEKPIPVPVPPGFIATGSPGSGQDVIQLDDGTAIFTGGLRRTLDVPPYGEHAIFRSKDSGRTWGDVTLLNLGLVDEEVALLKLPSGNILAALRGGGISGMAVWVSDSYDNGRNWSYPPRKVTDEWQHPADLLLLSEGSILMSFGSRHPPYGVRGLVSRDEGRTWDYQDNIVLVDNCSGWDCGYPTTVRLPDGHIVTAYYRKSSESPYFDGLCDVPIAAIIKYKESDLLNVLGV